MELWHLLLNKIQGVTTSYNKARADQGAVQNTEIEMNHIYDTKYIIP